jgi:hypothetical protein
MTLSSSTHRDKRKAHNQPHERRRPTALNELDNVPTGAPRARRGLPFVGCHQIRLADFDRPLVEYRARRVEVGSRNHYFDAADSVRIQPIRRNDVLVLKPGVDTSGLKCRARQLCFEHLGKRTSHYKVLFGNHSLLTIVIVRWPNP